MTKTDFMCICSEEPEGEAEACLKRVYEDLKCDASDLLSMVVFNLEWGLSEDGSVRGSIDGILFDQWGAVQASVKRVRSGFFPSSFPGNVVEDSVSEPRRQSSIGIYVECDRIEHGIARVWELAKEAAEELKAQ